MAFWSLATPGGATEWIACSADGDAASASILVGMVDVLSIARANVEAGGKKWHDRCSTGDGALRVGQAFENDRYGRCRLHRRRRLVDCRSRCGCSRRRKATATPLAARCRIPGRRRLGGDLLAGRDQAIVRVDLFDFDLPEDRIALRPASRAMRRGCCGQAGQRSRTASSATCRRCSIPATCWSSTTPRSFRRS